MYIYLYPSANTCMYMWVCVHLCLLVHIMSPSKTMIMFSNINVTGTVSSSFDCWFIAVVLGSGDEGFGDWKLGPSGCTCRVCHVDCGALGVPRKVPQTCSFQLTISAFPSAKTWPDPPNSSAPDLDLRMPHINEILSKTTRSRVFESEQQNFERNLFSDFLSLSSRCQRWASNAQWIML